MVVPGTATSLGRSCFNSPLLLPAQSQHLSLVSFPPPQGATSAPQEQATTSLSQKGTLLGASSWLCAAPQGGQRSVPVSRDGSQSCWHTGPCCQPALRHPRVENPTPLLPPRDRGARHPLCRKAPGAHCCTGLVLLERCPGFRGSQFTPGWAEGSRGRARRQ